MSGFLTTVGFVRRRSVSCSSSQSSPAPSPALAYAADRSLAATAVAARSIAAAPAQGVASVPAPSVALPPPAAAVPWTAAARAACVPAVRAATVPSGAAAAPVVAVCTAANPPQGAAAELFAATDPSRATAAAPIVACTAASPSGAAAVITVADGAAAVPPGAAAAPAHRRGAAVATGPVPEVAGTPATVAAGGAPPDAALEDWAATLGEAEPGSLVVATASTASRHASAPTALLPAPLAGRRSAGRGGGGSRDAGPRPRHVGTGRGQRGSGARTYTPYHHLEQWSWNDADGPVGPAAPPPAVATHSTGVDGAGAAPPAVLAAPQPPPLALDVPPPATRPRPLPTAPSVARQYAPSRDPRFAAPPGQSLRHRPRGGARSSGTRAAPPPDESPSALGGCRNILRTARGRPYAVPSAAAAAAALGPVPAVPATLPPGHPAREFVAADGSVRHDVVGPRTTAAPPAYPDVRVAPGTAPAPDEGRPRQVSFAHRESSGARLAGDPRGVRWGVDPAEEARVVAMAETYLAVTDGLLRSPLARRGWHGMTLPQAATDMVARLFALSLRRSWRWDEIGVDPEARFPGTVRFVMTSRVLLAAAAAQVCPVWVAHGFVQEVATGSFAVTTLADIHALIDLVANQARLAGGIMTRWLGAPPSLSAADAFTTVSQIELAALASPYVLPQPLPPPDQRVPLRARTIARVACSPPRADSASGLLPYATAQPPAAHMQEDSAPSLASVDAAASARQSMGSVAPDNGTGDVRQAPLVGPDARAPPAIPALVTVPGAPPAGPAPHSVAATSGLPVFALAARVGALRAATKRQPAIVATLPATPPGGRVIVVGDVHGCAYELGALLDVVRYDAARGDRVVLVGDLVAKGPDSAAVLQCAMTRGVYAVLGNHDLEVLHWCDVLDGAVPPPGAPEHARIAAALPADAVAWLRALPHIIDVPQHAARVVHAGIADARHGDTVWSATHMRSVRASDGAPSEDPGVASWCLTYGGTPHVFFGHDAPRGL